VTQYQGVTHENAKQYRALHDKKTSAEMVGDILTKFGLQIQELITDHL